MEPSPTLTEWCCVHPECWLYGKRGADNLTVRKIYGQDQIRYLRCRRCGEEFSERTGTALFPLKISEAQAVDVIDHLDAGGGVVSTAQVTKGSKDRVGRLLRVPGRPPKRGHDQRVQHLTPKGHAVCREVVLYPQEATSPDPPRTILGKRGIRGISTAWIPRRNG